MCEEHTPVSKNEFPRDYWGFVKNLQYFPIGNNVGHSLLYFFQNCVIQRAIKQSLWNYVLHSSTDVATRMLKPRSILLMSVTHYLIQHNGKTV